MVQRNNARGVVAAGNRGRAQYRAGNANAWQGKPIKCYNYNGIVDLDEEQLLFLPGGQTNTFDDETMFMANLSSADLVYDEAGSLYDSDTLFEDNEDQVVHSDVSSIPKDAVMIITNDIYEQDAPCVPFNNTVNASLTVELARYKELTKVYERRAQFELTERELMIDTQMRMIIDDVPSSLWRKTVFGMVTSMGIHHAKPYTLRGGPLTKLEQRLFKAWELNNHLKNSSISSKPDRAYNCTISGAIRGTAKISPVQTKPISITTIMFASTTHENMPMAYRASTSANPNPVISLAFIEANYEALESLLRDRRRQMHNNDLRTELEYFSEDYNKEREMEPRSGPTRATTPPL
ncbi:hypothetical protein Tco_0799000 [Tanacetum coccineum]